MSRSAAATNLVSAVQQQRVQPSAVSPKAHGSDRRIHPRLAPRDLAWLRGARLKYGGAVDVVDLSVGGALIETDAPLRPGATSVLELVDDNADTLVPFQVLRCHIASLKERPRYRGACEFKRPLLRIAPSHESGGAAAEPPFEPGRLDRALQQTVDEYLGGRRPAAETIVVIKAICAEAARRSSDVFADVLRRLLADALPILATGSRARFQAAHVEAQLRSMLPLLKIRLQSSAPLIYPSSVEPIYFRVGGSATPEVLSVELPLGSTIDQWEFRLLKCGAALMGLLRRWDLDESSCESPTIEEAATESEPRASSTVGWQKVIARYVDGGVVKGYSQDFHADRQSLHIRPSIDDEAAEQRVIPLSRLKAVFIVREFEGDAGYAESKTFSGPVQGRRVEVTFIDNEVILGTTLNYRPENKGYGFFISPADPQSNNIRIFVVLNAVRHVRFP